MDTFSIRNPLAWITVGLSLAACGPSQSAATPEAPTNGGETTTTAEASPSEEQKTVDVPTSADHDIRQAIDVFMKDPAKGDQGKIMAFVRDSPKVLVVYRSQFLQIDESDDLRTLMMAAFAAGNVLAQLDAGAKEDNPVAGVRAMISVYRKLQAANPKIRAAKLDDFAAHLDKGDLDTYVKDIAAKAAAQDKK